MNECTLGDPQGEYDVSGKRMFSGVMTAIMGEPFEDVDGNENKMNAAKKTGFYLNK